MFPGKLRQTSPGGQQVKIREHEGFMFLADEEHAGHHDTLITVNYALLDDTKRHYGMEVTARFGTSVVIGHLCEFTMVVETEDIKSEIYNSVIRFPKYQQRLREYVNYAKTLKCRR